MLAVPSASALLEMWENGAREHAVDRALTILGGFSGEPRDTLAALAVHRRDALLMQSRVLAFGPDVTGVASCSACACDVEVQLQLPPGDAALDDSGECVYAGVALSYRVPNSYDLAAAAACTGADMGERMLQTRCIAGSGALDDAALRAADEGIGALCAPVTIEVRSSCPQCGAAFAPPVDVATILWNEVAAYAQRLLADVDALALRYGWSERDILSLSDARRRHYLEGAQA